MSECLLYLAVVDGKTKIGITKDWKDRRSTYFRKGAYQVEQVHTWNFSDRSTAYSFEQLFLYVFDDYRITISKRKQKSEFITLSPEATQPYIDHVIDLMGNYEVNPPSNKKYTYVNLMPFLENKLRRTLRKRNMVLASD